MAPILLIRSKQPCAGPPKYTEANLRAKDGTCDSPKTKSSDQRRSFLHVKPFVGHLERNLNSTTQDRPNCVQKNCTLLCLTLFFSQGSVAEVLDDFPPLKETFDGTEWSDQRSSLIGDTTGEVYSASSRRDLSEEDLYLSSPNRCSGRTCHCTDQATASVILKWVGRPFGSGLWIITMLEKEANVDVI